VGTPELVISSGGIGSHHKECAKECYKVHKISGGRVWVLGGHKESFEGTKGRFLLNFEAITSSGELAQGVRPHFIQSIFQLMRYSVSNPFGKRRNIVEGGSHNNH
jgi:hypothetical protein